MRSDKKKRVLAVYVDMRDWLISAVEAEDAVTREDAVEYRHSPEPIASSEECGQGAAPSKTEDPGCRG